MLDTVLDAGNIKLNKTHQHYLIVIPFKQDYIYILYIYIFTQDLYIFI